MKRAAARVLAALLAASLIACAPDPAREYHQGLRLLQPDRVNPVAAVRHLSRAADAGVGAAAWRLALLYRSGAEGVPRDEQEALRRLQQAARKDVAQAQFLLGQMLLSGEAVPGDPGEARRWLEQAADHELPEAHLALALAAKRGELGLTAEDGQRHLMEAQHAAFHRPPAP